MFWVLRYLAFEAWLNRVGECVLRSKCDRALSWDRVTTALREMERNG